ncbi:MAG: bis(5'-nucleosyl)-tetraphosphatase (symmetrical) YqeK [Elusimicrobia bacterium]|nr:bis(5'-nucleosyl)-tetraphosphatase (symmetrical) YqeK [Elusimicrobiota bacterium]
MPAYRAPWKVMPAASARDRLDLARLGLLERLPPRWRQIARVDGREARARRPVYTVETLGALSGELHFVCGQDSAASFSRWKDATRLTSLASWWYGARPGAQGRPAAHFRRVPGRFPDISSTELRSALALGQDCSRELFPEILSLIGRRGLYGLGLLARLKATLSPSRYEHTLNVAALAEALARRHGADPEKARLAGLLHDAGRRLSPPLLAAYARRRNLRVPARGTVIALDPMLLHAYVSADLARREFKVTDEEVLGAVGRHTLGDRRMGLLDRVLYTADACSADRSYPGAAAIRALAFDDLDAALRRCVAGKIGDALRRQGWLHPLTVSLWNNLAAR